MPLSGSIEDRLEILELHARYATTSARGDKQGWLSCWTQDGAWVSHIFECHGREAILAKYEEIMAPFSKLFFLSQPGTIEISGETARGQSTALEIGELSAGGFFKLAGAYEDQFVKQDGEWLFSRRDYQPVVMNF